jgi:glycosyltransferase involved in cell wall biosynthesis
VQRVLLLAYFFPPIGGSGVQRSVKFARYLPSFGWTPVIVTGPAATAGEIPHDMTLGDELPADLEVLRARGPEPEPSQGWLGRSERWLRRPSPWARWWMDAAVEAGAAARDVDVIISTMSPFESAEAGARLAQKLGKPWIADLRDPWALDEMFAYPSFLHRRLDRRRMERLLRSAAAVVMNTPEAAAQMKRLLPALGDRVVSITNGFDPTDFAPPAPRENSTFRIVHAGDMHTALGVQHRKTAVARRLLGGTLGRVEVLTRSHLFLLQALDRLIEADPTIRDRVELRLVGNLTESDRAAISTRARVATTGYLPHGEAVGAMQAADLLFFPMHELEPGRRARIVPGKLYEYLATGRPILGAVPQGDARDLMLEAGAAWCCEPSDVDAMAATILARLQAHEAGEPPPARRADVLARYERRALTARLAELLDEIAPAEAGSPRELAAAL